MLEELDVGHIPMVSVWNKVDVCADPEMVQTVASKRENTVCISAQTGQGLSDLMNLVQDKIEQSMMPVSVLVPYAQVFAALAVAYHCCWLCCKLVFTCDVLQTPYAACVKPQMLAEALGSTAAAPFTVQLIVCFYTG